ncbi:disease resistance protein RPM1-like [Malania oleifera]|uniref:disease resistance protein RPM1-like n=1 Tax=Malania oleifera TaxID=397392 RepID=UPI0025AE7D72|nr:disease resistance protein RPM1-like [Malania oleifera]
MAMIAVKIVLEKLSSLVGEEANLLGGLGKEIEVLQDDLDSMKSFLQDAEARSENDQAVRTWVKQVRDVAYDAEDVLEEFLLRLVPPHGNGFLRCLRTSYHHISQSKARHQLAVQIQRIKDRVRNISQRRSTFSFNDTSAGTSLQEWHDPRRASLYIDEADVVGIENPKALLMKWLVEGEQKLTAVSVAGMGGLGKTTLVKKAFDSHPVKRAFNCHAWVTVSKSFTTEELLRAALKGFLEATKEPAPEGMESMIDFQLVDKLRNHLQQKRYVIVLDDVWSPDAWEAVKYALPDCNNGSRIIFTTRLIDLADSIETTGHVYHLQPLPEREAWTLFCMKAFRGERRGICPEELEEISRSVLKKCGGLPLAIVVIGGLLSKKKRILEWKKVHDNLAAEMKSDCHLGNLERILLLSYEDLPHHLKCCYLYLSAFPEDYLIKRMKLIRLWVSERFVEEKQGLTMEEVAEDYLNELVNRSMIQVAEMDQLNRVRTCSIHDLMREIIQLKSREESLLTVVGESGVAENEKVRRLSIHGNCNNLMSSMRFPYLRSIFLFTRSCTSFRRRFFSCFRLLRVLELEGVPLSSLPPEVVELIHLRYLSLRSTEIKQLPESIGKLKNLEILDLKGTLISSVPKGILEMKHLCQLRNFHYRFESSTYFGNIYGTRVPTEIGRLMSLQKLGTVDINDDIELVKELGKLTQLRRLGVLNLGEQHGTDFCYSLEKLKHLTTLYMLSKGTLEVIKLDSLSSPPEFLQRLYLKCRLLALPQWLASLHHLVKLVLQYSNLKVDPLKALQGLRSLVMLELRQAYDGEELSCDKLGYPKLKKLFCHQLQRLKCIKIADGAMTELRALDIAACWELERVPIGTEHLKNLQDLLLWDMPSEFLERIGRLNGEDFWKVQHISTIKHVYKSGQRWAAETLS